MKTLKEFILESFLDRVKDEETKNKIKELMQAGKHIEAYRIFKDSPKDTKPAKWSPVNPKMYPEKWKNTAK